MIQEMNSKCNETKTQMQAIEIRKNTSASNKDRVRVRGKAIANTGNLF